MIMFDRRLLKNYAWALLLITLIFTAVGLMNLYSASSGSHSVFRKQLIWVSLGCIAMVFVSFLDVKFLRRYANHIYAASLVLLVAVLIFGREVSGSQSWIYVGSFLTFQPSEFAKIAIILAVSRFFAGDFEEGPYGFSDLLKPLGLITAPLVLVILQPDLGTGVMILLISASLIAFMGIKRKSLLLVLLVILGLSYPSWEFFLKDYQKERIMTFIDPSRDPLGAGYNAIQSQIAVGSGKFFGKGFQRGSQTQLRFLPAQHTDFAFSVLAEEWGFLGGIFVLLLYFLIILWILDTASRAKEKFAMLVSLGVAAMFFWHVVANVGMIVGLLPVMGVPLLLFSYGGSSLLTAMAGVGIVMGIRMRKLPMEKEAVQIR